MVTKLVSKAPTRIDLAGGTIDIWPLYLFLDRPITVNVGIDLFAETELTLEKATAGNKGIITLRSGDQGNELHFEWAKLSTQEAPPSLILHLKLLKHFATEHPDLVNEFQDRNLTLATRAKSPAGAGLGGSSTLAVSIIGALSEWLMPGEAIDRERLIDVVKDTETTVIQVPAGLQDYYGAMYGGLQAIHWRVAGHSQEYLPENLLGEIESRLILFYSGQSRNSGINNWALFKAFIDKDETVRSLFRSIASAAEDTRSALLSGDFQAVGMSIANEWSARRQLAKGITTPEIDRAFETAKKLGATAAKICGAGGGGCFFVYLPTPDTELRNRIVSTITSQDASIRELSFHCVPRGVSVQ